MKYLLLFLVLSLPALAQQPIRVCTYDVVDFSEQTPSSRVAAIGTVLDEIMPTILVTHEMTGLAGALRFQNDVLQFVDSRLNLGSFIDGPDSDNAIYVDTTRISVISHSVIKTDFRNIDGWLVVIYPTIDTLIVVGSCLKSGDDSASRSQRAAEAINIHLFCKAFDGVYPYIVAGNLNVYSSAEPAYQTLIANEPGQLVDPINRPGAWHNNDAYADIHTQATHDTASSSFISGGLDDRFDFVLFSPSLIARYAQGSYTTFGNDARHFNKSINAEPANTAVTQEVAHALYNASDHLPVFLDLNMQVTGVDDDTPQPTDIDLR